MGGICWCGEISRRCARPSAKASAYALRATADRSAGILLRSDANAILASLGCDAFAEAPPQAERRRMEAGGVACPERRAMRGVEGNPRPKLPSSDGPSA